GMKIDDQIFRGEEPIHGTASNPDEFEGCQLCIVEVEGAEGFTTACDTPVADGMVVHTNTPEVQRLRRANLAKILAEHPHACLVCAEGEGCSKEPCSLNVPVNERCCDKFGNCELQRVAEYIGIEEDVPRYVFRELPVEESPLIIRDLNLCISCGRCVRVCRDLRGVEALGLVYNGEEYVVGTLDSTLEDSGCKFCGACIEVCPTGAIMDKDLRWPPSEEDLIPCKHVCPVGIDIPRYIHFIDEERFDEAAAVIRGRVPFPGVLGQVCHHPCEDECRRGKLNEAMAICALKRFAAEHDTESWKTELKGAPPTGKRVAIVGSGPAGLTAAHYLARKGHAVTIFESQSELGGMMRFGAPAYRLPRAVLNKEIADILELGVDVKPGVQIGEDLSLEDLENQYEATFLATG
ncbi:MAG: NAD(P)-binding protein, partial [Candidatus Bathyarchaeota archaeon]